MGLGGGFLFLLYFALTTDIPQQSVGALNLLFFLPISLLAVIFHIKNKLLNIKVCLIMAVSGALFVYFGFSLAASIKSDILRNIFAIFVIVVGIKELISNKER